MAGARRQSNDEIETRLNDLESISGENLSALRQYSITVTGGSSWATTRAVAVPYKTIDGTWRIRINVAGVTTTTTTLTLTITGIVFKTGFSQALAGSSDNFQGMRCIGNGGTNTITIASATSDTLWYVSGDVELNAQPAFVI